jgi:NAD(P)-dependent dehydrogenase (short-subunit alcohol dehydrogenase family)
MSLAGRVAIVTGGAARIGAEIVSALADEGMPVCIHYGQSEKAAEALAARIAATGHPVTTISADLRESDSSAGRIVNHCVQTLGPPEVLVCSASVFEPGTLQSTRDEDWDRYLAIHLKAPAALCREFVRARAPGQRQHILMMLDGRVLRPGPGHLAYTVSKCALASLTRILALELAPDVQVNGIAPGAILPPEGASEDHLRRAEEKIPLKRRGEPSDIVETVLFLLRSDFITGQIVTVAGGEEL